MTTDLFGSLVGGIMSRLFPRPLNIILPSSCLLHLQTRNSEEKNVAFSFSGRVEHFI